MMRHMTGELARFVPPVLGVRQLAFPQLSAGVEIHQGSDRNSMSDNRNGDRGQREDNRLLGERAGKPVMQREHQVIDRADAADAEPRDEQALVARYRGAERPAAPAAAGR